jgi:hypothetical protein
MWISEGNIAKYVQRERMKEGRNKVRNKRKKI